MDTNSRKLPDWKSSLGAVNSSAAWENCVKYVANSSSSSPVFVVETTMHGRVSAPSGH